MNDPATAALRQATDTPGTIDVSAKGDRVLVTLERSADYLEMSPDVARTIARALLACASKAEGTSG